jgi:hypothetical protein
MADFDDQVHTDGLKRAGARRDAAFHDRCAFVRQLLRDKDAGKSRAA